jgi:hypothetical protein
MKIKFVAAAAVALLLQAQAFAGSNYGRHLVASNDWIICALKMLQDAAANAIANLR